MKLIFSFLLTALAVFLLICLEQIYGGQMVMSGISGIMLFSVLWAMVHSFIKGE